MKVQTAGLAPSKEEEEEEEGEEKKEWRMEERCRNSSSDCDNSSFCRITNPEE